MFFHEFTLFSSYRCEILVKAVLRVLFSILQSSYQDDEPKKKRGKKNGDDEFLPSAVERGGRVEI
jgi:hypothetical protein